VWSLHHIKGEIIKRKNRTANRRNADSFSFQAELDDGFRNQLMDDSVGTAGQ